MIKKILILIGEIFDSLKGKSFTYEDKFLNKNKFKSIKTTIKNHDEIFLTIHSTRHVYITRYKFWWVPNRIDLVFEVEAIVEQNKKDLFDINLFNKEFYPLLSNPLLKWTNYPHLKAINAFLDRFKTFI